MENLYYNGVNIIDLAKRKKPQIYSVVSAAPPRVSVRQALLLRLHPLTCVLDCSQHSCMVELGSRFEL